MAVDNTSVNVGKHKSIIVEAKKKNPEIKLMGCPCHIAHNTAQYATWKFEEIINGFKRKRKSDGERVSLKFEPLKSYFLSQEPEK